MDSQPGGERTARSGGGERDVRQVKQELSPRERRVFVELPAIRAVLTLALPTIFGLLITVI